MPFPKILDPLAKFAVNLGGISGSLASDNYINSLYLRFEVKDKPGVLAQITNRLALKNISVERLIQIPNYKNKTASIVIITHKSKELDAQHCISAISKSKNILKYPTLIRLL